jgi:hypothetical protein
MRLYEARPASFALTPRQAPVTLKSALDFAVDKTTTKRRRGASAQDAEWARASAVLTDELPLAHFTALHVYAVALSAMVGVAYEVKVDAWSTLLVAAATELGVSVSRSPHTAEEVIARALLQCKQQRPTSTAGRQGSAPSLRESTLSWATRTPELLRAMLRHAARRDRDGSFGSLKGYELPEDALEVLASAADGFGITILNQHRPGYTVEDVRVLMDHVRDPRYPLQAALASKLNGTSALRVPRTRIRIDSATAVSVERNSGSDEIPRLSWTALGASESAVVIASLRGPFAAYEQDFLQHGVDYRPIMDVRWANGALHRVTTDTPKPKHPRDVGLLDPRAWLLAVLAPEGRGGQVLRCSRSDLLIEQQSQELLLSVPGSGSKLGPTWMLCTQQRHALALAMEVGHLCHLEAQYRSGAITDYPLMPAGKLSYGRAVPSDPTLRASVDDRTLHDWILEIEAVLGLAHVGKRGWHGWRRACARLFDLWHTNPRVKDLITGHAELLPTTHGRTRQEVYLDQKDLRLLRAAQRLCEYARTTFIVTGEGPPRPNGSLDDVHDDA